MRQAAVPCQFVSLAILLVLCANAHGVDGSQLIGFGAIQKSLGGAGAAGPQDATWILINPATLTDLHRRIDVSLELLHLNLAVEPKGLFLLSNPFAGEMTYSPFVAIPSFAAVCPLDDLNTLGFGVILVAGNRTDFDHPRATLALFDNGDRRASVQIARMPLCLSHKFENGWAVGIAAMPAFMRLRTDSLTIRLHTTRGDNRYDMAYGAGFGLGIYKNWDKWSLGAAYLSRVWMTNFSKYEHDLTFASLDLPEQVQVGVAYRPIQRLQLVLDYKRINWEAIPLFGRETVHAGLGWNNQDIVKGGIVWDINEKWTVRAGFSLTNPVVDDEHIFSNLLTPSVPESHVATGFSCRLNDRSSVHAAYEMSIPKSQTDSGKGDIFSFLGKGSRVSYEEHSVTAQYTYRF